MPKFEPKQIQTEIEKGVYRSLYFLYGSESMKMRELTKRIKNAYLGISEKEDEKGNLSSQFSEIILDGAQSGGLDGGVVADECDSLMLGVPAKVVLVKNAHQLKDGESLLKRVKNETFSEDSKESCVLILWSKDLDLRKKWIKKSVDDYATISCEEVLEKERPEWIRYLMKRRSFNQSELSPEEVNLITMELLTIDPWSLDIVDQVLQRLEVTPKDYIKESLLNEESYRSKNLFLDAFLSRNKKDALLHLSSFSTSPEESLPMAGLISWNLREMTKIKQNAHSSSKPLSSFIRDKFRKPLTFWSIDELMRASEKLTSFDASLKGSNKDPHSSWCAFVLDVL